MGSILLVGASLLSYSTEEDKVSAHCPLSCKVRTLVYLPAKSYRTLKLSQKISPRMAEFLFEDVFKIDQLNPDGKKFDKVTRIEAKSEKFDMFMHLDVNTEVYPLREGEKFSMALSSTLNEDGTPDTGYFTPGNRKTLADNYEYVMQGKLYRISEGSGQGKAEINASFGGLLMMLKGDPSYFKKYELDQRLFLLIRKV